MDGGCTEVHLNIALLTYLLGIHVSYSNEPVIVDLIQSATIPMIEELLQANNESIRNSSWIDILRNSLPIQTIQFSELTIQNSINNESSSLITRVTSNVLSYRPIVIETTFLPPNVVTLLSKYLLPNAKIINLNEDSIDYIEDILTNYVNEFSYSLRGAVSICCDEFNKTPLHYACQYGNLTRVEWLLKKMGSRIDLKDSKGNTALHT